jgi:hypothetical protein
MCCYGATTGGKSFLFIVHYERRVNIVRSKTTTRNDAVGELVMKPLHLYHQVYGKLLQNKKIATETVISRSHHASLNYIPLAYVHLLVQPEVPLYADVNYNKTLEDILAFAAGISVRDVMTSVLYNNTDPNEPPITHDTSATPLPVAYEIIAGAHYDLMKNHNFVIPETATQEHILFDALAPGQHSQHLDYIAAVCDVRYNWAFDPAHGYICDTVNVAPNTHEAIDILRHITHLQSPSDTQSKFLKKLSTGWHVTEIGGAKRKGVIVFDVQEHGRFNVLFKGQNDPQPKCHDVCETFGTGGKTSNREIALAMLDYFGIDTDAWSLCDMAYKYVMYDTASPPGQTTYFMRDSFQLERDRSISDSASACSFCPFCPVCFEAQPDTLGAGGTTMYHHIKAKHDAHQYYISYLPEPAAPALAAPAAPALQAPAASSAAASHAASDPPADPAAFSAAANHAAADPPADPGNVHPITLTTRTPSRLDGDVLTDLEEINELLDQFKKSSKTPLKIDDIGQADLSEGNYAQLLELYKQAQKHIDEANKQIEKYSTTSLEMADKIDEIMDKLFEG